MAQRAGVAVAVLVVALLVVAAVTLPIGGTGGPSPSPRLNPTAAAPASVGPTPMRSSTTAAPPPSAAPVPETGIDIGQLPPDFELRTPEGEVARLSDYRGRPVWINFWAPSCPACRTEMPRLEGFYLRHLADGLVIVGVGVRDSRESLRAYADEVGVTYPIVVDGDGAVANAFQALALPVHYWIDRDGVVRDWAFGELPPDLLAASLESILGTASAPPR